MADEEWERRESSARGLTKALGGKAKRWRLSLPAPAPPSPRRGWQRLLTLRDMGQLGSIQRRNRSAEGSGAPELQVAQTGAKQLKSGRGASMVPPARPHSDPDPQQDV